MAVNVTGRKEEKRVVHKFHLPAGGMMQSRVVKTLALNFVGRTG
jgi:hypothetical protein